MFNKCFATITFILLSCVIAQSQNTLYHSQPESLYRKGLELVEKNNFAAAREIFEQYVTTVENGASVADAEYYIAFSALNLYHADGEKLLEKFISQHENHPKSSQAYFELGNFYFRENNFEKAAEYLSKVRLSLLSEEQRNETRFKLGYAYFAQRSFDNAKSFFDALKNKKTKYTPASNYYAGYIAYEQGNYTQAITDLQTAEKDEAYKSVVPGMLADLYYKQGMYDQLLSYSEKVLNSGTRVNQRDFYLLAAEAHSKKENYQKAVTFYDQYLDGLQNPPLDVQYRIGFANFKAGNLDKAANHLKQVASKSDALGSYASYYLGVVYLKQGNKVYAITAFDNARRADDKQLSEEASFQYVKVSYDLDRIEESITAARKFLESHPNSEYTEEISDLLSSAYLNTNNYNLAIDYIEGLVRPNQKQQAVYQKATFLKGMELFNLGNYQQAISFFSKSLKNPIDAKFKAMAALWTGEAYSVGRKYDEALPYYKTALGVNLPATDETRLKAQYGIGYAYYNTKEYRNALENFRLYVNNVGEGNGYYDDALLRLADCYYVTKSYGQALAYYQRAIKTNNADNDYAHLQTGIVNGLEGNTSEAIKEYNFVIKTYPKSRYIDDAMFRKAQLNFEKGNYQIAVDNFTDLIEGKPTSQFVPYAYMRRASAHYNLKNYEKSTADYVTVLEEFSSHSVAEEALLPLQEVLNLQGKSGQFDQYLSKYKRANPENKGLASIEFETAKNQYFNLNYDKSISSFKEYIRDYPENSNIPEAQYFIGESYYRLNKYDQALEYYNKLLAEGNYSPMSKVINRIGELEFASGRYENATYFFYQLIDAARTKKEQYYAWSGLMESYYQIGKYDSVAHYANVILEKGNVNISSQNKASLYLGKAAYAQKNYDKAKDEFINTLNSAKDEFGAEAQFLLGKIFYEQGQYQKSIEALIELNNSFNVYKSWVGKSYLLLADNYVALGDFFQAKGTLKSIIENFPLEQIKTQAKEKLKQVEAEEKRSSSNNNAESDTLIIDN